MFDAAEELRRIEGGMVALGRFPSQANLRSGVSPDRARALLAECGLPAFDDLEAVYGWHDGSDTQQAASLDDLHLFPGFYLLSLEDAVASYRSLGTDPRWTAGWFPLFANGGGDFYLLDLLGDSSGSVRHFRIDECDHPIEFDSLAAMLATLAASYDHGIFYLDDDGYLEMDDLEFGKMAARFNPGVTWWQE